MPTTIRHSIAPEFLNIGQAGQTYSYGGITTTYGRTYTDADGVHWLEATADLTDEQVAQLGDEHWPWEAVPTSSQHERAVAAGVVEEHPADPGNPQGH